MKKTNGKSFFFKVEYLAQKATKVFLIFKVSLKKEKLLSKNTTQLRLEKKTAKIKLMNG